MSLPVENISQVSQVRSDLFKTVDLSLPGGFTFSPTYIQAGLIVFLLFLLILTFGSLRHRYNHWTVKGVMPGVTFGFVLAIFVEALLIASGSTIFISILGWKNPPKPLANALDSGRTKLVTVLGTEDEKTDTSIEESDKKSTIGSIMNEYTTLEDSEKESLQTLICKPQ